ncbi:MAG: DUF4179 domain-containing protein [Clostridiales bacterium]|nr:DUF4179 domain-containing protein [Clostridiales bacterium]
MKRFDPEKLKQAYPGMTEEFSARMNALIRSLPSRKEEPKMKKKMTLTLAFALALTLLLTATAVAAGLGAFGQLANAHDPDRRLEDLDAVAAPVQETVTAADGVAVTVEQAYYDGERVFVSYRITGGLTRAETGHGTLEGVDWFDPGDYEIALDPDSPAASMVEALRAGEAGDWARVTQAAVHDGLFLSDGTCLDIIGGEERLLPDGTVLGWKECEVPQDLAGETLACKAVVFRVTTTYQKTDRGLRAAYERVPEETDVPFTVRKETAVTRLTGASAVDGLYAARAECTLNRVDLKATVTLQCPESWVRAWMDWEYQRDSDLIESWALYSGEERIGGEGNDRGVAGEGTELTYETILRHGGKTENLRLVPVYADGGERPEEAIALQAQ